MANESAFRTGEIVGNHQTTIVTAEMSAATTANELQGRIIYLTGSPSAQGRYRRVLSNSSSSGGDNTCTITLDAPFDGTSALRGLTPNAQSNDHGATAEDEASTLLPQSFSVSKTLAECNTSDIEDITDDNADRNTYRQITDLNTSEAWTLLEGCVVYDEDVDFTFFSQWSTGNSSGSRRQKLTMATDTALIFGRQNFGDLDNNDIIGWTSHDCVVRDKANDFSGSENNWRGAFHINGGVFFASGVADSGLSVGDTFDSSTRRGPFYRSYSSSGTSWRMWNTKCYGHWGIRVDNPYSVFYNVTIIGNSSFYGVLGPLGNIGVLEDVFMKDCGNAVYNYPLLAETGTIGPIDLQEINDAIIYLNSSGDNETTTLQDWDLDQLVNEASKSGTDLVTTAGSDGSDQTYNWRKRYKLDITEGNGSAISTDDDAKVRFESIQDTSQEATSNGGDVPAQNLLAYQVVVAGNDPNVTDFNNVYTTKYIGNGWQWAAYYRNHNIVQGSTTLQGPLGRVEASSTRSVDNTITETDTDTVDAYTELETAAKLYDFSGKYKYDNMEFPTLSTLPFTREGNVIGLTHERTNVTFNNSASNVMAITSATKEDDVEHTLAYIISGDFTANNQFAVRQGDSITDTNVGNTDWEHLQDQYLFVRLDTQANTKAFLEECKETGTIQLNGSGSENGVFDISSAEIMDHGSDGAYVQLGTLVSHLGLVPYGTATNRILEHNGFEAWNITIDAGDNGYTEGIDVGDRDLVMDNTIQGEITCAQLTLTGVADSGDIIDTSETITTETGDGNNGLLVESTSNPTYFVRGNPDLSGAKISRAGTGDVTVTMVDFTGTLPETGTGVTLQEEITFRVNLPEGHDFTIQDFKFRAAEYDGDTEDDNNLSGDASKVDGEDAIDVKFTVAAGNTVKMACFLEGFPFEMQDSADGLTIDWTNALIADSSLDLQAYMDATDSEHADYNETLANYVIDTQTGWNWSFASNTLTITAPSTAISLSDTLSRVLVYYALAGEVGEDKSDNSDEEFLYRLTTGDLETNAFTWLTTGIEIRSANISSNKYNVLFNHTTSTTDTEWSVQIFDDGANNRAAEMSTSTSAERVRFAASATANFIDSQTLGLVVDEIETVMDARYLTADNVERLGKLQTVNTD